MTLATIGIAILLFSIAVQATTTIRPIDDWAGEKIIGWGDPDSGLVIHPHAVEWSDIGMPYNFFFWEYKTIWECQYKGFIQERVIDEEHTLITIHLHVKEVPFMLFNWSFSGAYPFYLNYEPISAGIMNYNFQCRILFNTMSLYNILEAYEKIPSLFNISYTWPYPEEPVPVVTYWHLTGEGYLTVGGEGTVKVNQVGILNPGTGDFMWPAEIVIIE